MALLCSRRRLVFGFQHVLLPFRDSDHFWQAAANTALERRTALYAAPAAVSSDESASSKSAAEFEAALRRVFLGQPRAVAAVANAIAARLDDFAVDVDGSPLVMAFLGPSGVGKSELARQLARVVHGGASVADLEARGKLKRFAMNQYAPFFKRCICLCLSLLPSPCLHNFITFHRRVFGVVHFKKCISEHILRTPEQVPDQGVHHKLAGSRQGQRRPVQRCFDKRHSPAARRRDRLG